MLALLGIESWKPVLTALALPPVPFLLLMLIGARLILPRRGIGWTVVLLSAVLMWLSTTGGAAWLLAQGLLKPPAALDGAQIADIKARVQAKQPIAVVVLGGGMRPLAPEYAMSTLTPLSVERLRYGLWLGRATGAPVAFSGGIGWGEPEGNTPEGDIAARIAQQEFGRPLKWVESRSRDTRENAAMAVAMARQDGIREILLVTHDIHEPRALRAFEEAAQGGIRIRPAPIGTIPAPRRAVDWLPSESGFMHVRTVLHEALGRLFGA